MDEDLCRGLNDLERILDGSKKPGKLKLPVLSRITSNFSDEQKIGQGGCGHVYKGILPSGQIVAVKKLLNAKTMDDRMFQQEVAAMMRVKHQNIVRFLGYCSHIEEQAMKIKGKYVLVEERERLLCFEFMSKGSLADYVTDELRGLEWHTRFQIIEGICDGLYHLHKEKRIIHMDLKPPNILLDDDLVPKITDLGISRHGEISKTISQERLCSPGYCAPEYQFNGKMSFKSDIYSLGVIIREMVTGSRGDPNIAMVHRRWRHRWKKHAKHTTLGYEQQVNKCLELAQRCQSWNPKDRPNIQDIIRGIKEVENAGCHITDANKSTVEQKNSFLEDMLRIEPLELHFSAELNSRISHLIELTNDTDDYVAFRIWFGEKNIALGFSASRLPFCMLPNKDVVPPRSSCSVTIKLESLKKPLREEHCTVELCVQSTRVDIGLTSKDITADFFMKDPDNMVDTVNLMVSVHAPKQLLDVKPLELRYWPIVPNKLFPCSLQMTNRTDDYVAFAFIFPQGKVLYNQVRGTGIMRPWSTRGVVIDMLVKEEALAEMQCKDTCLVRSVIVDKDLRDDEVSVDMFYELTGVQEVELDIVFAATPQQHQIPSSVHHPIYNYDEQDSEDDEPDLMRDQTMLVSLISMFGPIG